MGLQNLTAEQKSQAARAVLRQKLLLFARQAFRIVYPNAELIDATYIETLCFELQDAAEGRTPRLVVNVPPRHLKSFLAAIVLPAWHLGNDPSAQILIATYGETLSKEHARSFERLVTSGLFQELFPGFRVERVGGSVPLFRTAQGGGVRGVTSGGAVTGIGADLIIVDDLMKASDANSEARRQEARDYFEGTLISRLNNKATGRVIVIQQRLHQDDLTAHLIEKDYRHVSFPAVARDREIFNLYAGFNSTREPGDLLSPKRESSDTLEQLKRDMGASAYEAQYQQNPGDAGTGMLNLDRLTLIDGAADDHQRLKIVQCWDTAVKDSPNCDYSVCATFAWDGTQWIIIDVLRRRLDFESLKREALRLRKRWEPETVIVEDSGNGTALVSDLRSSTFFEFKTISVSASKVERFAPAAEWLENGTIGILHENTWWPDLRRELASFPNGRHDDQVDAISLFVSLQKSRKAPHLQKARRGSRRPNAANRAAMEIEYGV